MNYYELTPFDKKFLNLCCGVIHFADNLTHLRELQGVIRFLNKRPLSEVYSFARRVENLLIPSLLIEDEIWKVDSLAWRKLLMIMETYTSLH
jgi:hypothetical protein